jgi:tRNA threonylcarbamoyladenosine biosynthesis protein TsaE
MKTISRSLEETAGVAKSFLETLEKGEKAVVVALSGELGSGKTAFSQAVGEILGVKGVITSPTFVIQKIYRIDYKGFKNLIHIDAYRLDKESELLHLGWEEIIAEPENLILIEWPERVGGIIPSDVKKISFEHLVGEARSINYEN